MRFPLRIDSDQRPQRIKCQYFCLSAVGVTFHTSGFSGSQAVFLSKKFRAWGMCMAPRRQFIQSVPAIGPAFAVSGRLVPDQPAPAQAAAPAKGHVPSISRSSSERTCSASMKRGYASISRPMGAGLRHPQPGCPYSTSRLGNAAGDEWA